ncbi:MAG: hypothetical protein RSB86_17310 [Comamonas sp.]|uniref:hypothetical protein n=1 Tax=Comamonas sp. TaxID=34028 RepID=UPI002FC8D7C6
MDYFNNLATVLTQAIAPGDYVLGVQGLPHSAFVDFDPEGAEISQAVEAVLTLSDPSNPDVFEIVEAYSFASTLTGGSRSYGLEVYRGIENTEQRDWPVGTLVQARITAGMLDNLEDEQRYLKLFVPSGKAARNAQGFGDEARAGGESSLAVGTRAMTELGSEYGLAIGQRSTAAEPNAMALGGFAYAGGANSVALNAQVWTDDSLAVSALPVLGRGCPIHTESDRFQATPLQGRVSFEGHLATDTVDIGVPRVLGSEQPFADMDVVRQAGAPAGVYYRMGIAFKEAWDAEGMPLESWPRRADAQEGEGVGGYNFVRSTPPGFPVYTPPELGSVFSENTGSFYMAWLGIAANTCQIDIPEGVVAFVNELAFMCLGKVGAGADAQVTVKTWLADGTEYTAITSAAVVADGAYHRVQLELPAGFKDRGIRGGIHLEWVSAEYSCLGRFTARGLFVTRHDLTGCGEGETNLAHRSGGIYPWEREGVES